MGYRLREPAAEGKFSSALGLDALSRVVPAQTIRAVLAAEGRLERRERKLTMTVVVFLVVAMHLYTHLSLGQVLSKLAQGLRYIWPDPDYAVAGDAALSYRRYQLGARPLVALFHQVCQPLEPIRKVGGPGAACDR